MYHAKPKSKSVIPEKVLVGCGSSSVDLQVFKV